MQEIVVRTGVVRETGFLYYLKGTDIYRGKKGSKAQLVKEVSFKRQSGYLYFLDKDGHVARSPMKRKGS